MLSELRNNIVPNVGRRVYIDKQTGKPVEMDHRIEGELRAKARKKIDKASKGIKIGLTDIASILSMIKGEIHAG